MKIKTVNINGLVNAVIKIGLSVLFGKRIDTKNRGFYGFLSMKIQLDTSVISHPVIRHIQYVNCYFGEFVLSSRIRSLEHILHESGAIRHFVDCYHYDEIHDLHRQRKEIPPKSILCRRIT